jgi:acetyl-CoA synthetase
MQDPLAPHTCLHAPDSSLQPMWVPSTEAIEHSNIKATMKCLAFDSYRGFYQFSVDQSAKFWSSVIDALRIQFAEPPAAMQTVGETGTDPIWLPGARMNIAASCFQAAEGSVAIICGAENGKVTRMSYRELQSEAYRVANGLRKLGLERGDAVALFMPMNARAVAIYLGTILAGCVVVSIADSLSREQVLLRLRIGQAKVVFATEFLQRGENRIPLYSRVAGLGLPVIIADDAVSNLISLNPRDLRWGSFVGGHSFQDVAYVDSASPINILFSSGTTGEPKAIVWDHVTPLRAASDGHFHQDIHPGDVVA